MYRSFFNELTEPLRFLAPKMALAVFERDSLILSPSASFDPVWTISVSILPMYPRKVTARYSEAFHVSSALRLQRVSSASHLRIYGSKLF